MSAMSSSKLPPELYALGDVQAEYTGHNLFVTGLVGAALATVVGAVLLGLYLATGFFFPVLTVLIPLAIVGGLGIAVKGLIDGRKRALVFKDGIAEVRRGKTTVMRWDDVTSVNQKITVQRQRSGRQGKPTYTYTLRSPNGMLVFSAYQGIEQLGNTIQTEVGKRLGPRMIDAYNHGETLKFGKVTVSKAGLDIGQGLIPWPQVEQVTLSLGKLAVRRNGQWTEMVGQTAGQTPNLNVLMVLVKEITGGDKK